MKKLNEITKKILRPLYREACGQTNGLIYFLESRKVINKEDLTRIIDFLDLTKSMTVFVE